MTRLRPGRGTVALRPVAAGLVAIGLILLAAAAVLAATRTTDGTSGTQPRSDQVVALPPNLGSLAGGAPATGTLRSRTPAAVSPPAHRTRLLVPSLGVDAPVVPVRLRGRVMQVPRDPRVVGWWREGAVPGSGAGTAVLVGHVNYDGIAGALGALPRARPGDAVTLTGGARFRVTAVRVYPKSSGLPAAVFARSGSPRLVLITCGGPFDPVTGNYEDNIVVFARRAA